MLPLFEVWCPCCGEPLALAVDDSGGNQQYIEDCQVCCRPLVIAVHVDGTGGIEVTARREDDA